MYKIYWYYVKCVDGVNCTKWYRVTPTLELNNTFKPATH